MAFPCAPLVTIRRGTVTRARAIPRRMAQLLPLVAVLTSTAGAQTLQERLQTRLDSLHRAGQFAGAQIGVALPDGSVIAVATGLADTAKKEAMTTGHLLLQGSVGKTYASAVALQLVHEGRIALDDPIAKYLGSEPWFHRLPNAQSITIRQLMNHTSGLVRYEFNERFTADLTASPDRVWKPHELVSYILDTTAPFAAGQGWDYSDTNYIVLGMIMEKVTGRAYYDLARERVLGPAGLTATVPSDARAIRGLANGYAGANNPFGGTDAMLVEGRMVINPQFEWTGGGMASTAADLARWGKWLYEGKAFDPSMLPRLLDGVPARLGQNTRYGLGVIIRETPSGTVYGHSGFFPGYQAEMLYLPSAKAAIAFQVNSSVPGALGRGVSPARFAIEIAGIVTGELQKR
ncbi:MAG TPA: serine hydrolase domain-containing protein [Gemmatimonadaceae bacterium]